MTTYDDVNGAWEGVDIPTLSMKEASKRALQLSRKFGDGSMPWRLSNRRSWASTARTRLYREKGWRNLVHDVSHWVHNRNHKGYLKTHSRPHAQLELAMIEHVKRKGWLVPKVKPQPTLQQKRDVKLTQLQASIKRWESKQKRAVTALRKLKQKERRLTRLAHDTAAMVAHV